MREWFGMGLSAWSGLRIGRIVRINSAVYLALVAAGMIDPSLRDRRSRKLKRWERGTPMELRQLDVVARFPIAGRSSTRTHS